jgi:hypothetical protein
MKVRNSNSHPGINTVSVVLRNDVSRSTFLDDEIYAIYSPPEESFSVLNLFYEVGYINYEEAPL